uniref:Uncharacterized protein n=1 Tax=Nannospalax galili TaxID=1026970 RepID=A0A8C6QX12_NANGA
QLERQRSKKQEYFERNKLKSKMKSLGVFSPVKNPTASLDLLNLYMVNQISSKKKTPETTKRPTHVNMNKDLKLPLRKHDLELPMSPHCVPSKLCIDDTENNVPYQRLTSKEEIGPLQSSQDTNSYRRFKMENYTCLPPRSFPAELPSNRHIPKHNFTPRIALSPQKFACVKKQNEQFSNRNCSDPLTSKLNEHQDVFISPHESAQFGTLFERINRPENGDFIPERANILMAEDCGRLQERRRPDAIVGRQAAQHWGHSGKGFSHFLNDVSQPTQRHLKDSHDSFVSHNMINLLNRDQLRIKETFPKCGYDTSRKVHVVCSDESCSTDGFIKSSFVVPESTFSNSTFNTCYVEMCQSNKSYQKEYSDDDIHEFRRPFEDCYPSSSGNKEKLENDDQEKALHRNSHEYPHSLQTHPLISDVWSSQSSQSASYSPRATESCFSSSSDIEDQISQQIENSDKKTSEASNNYYQERTVKNNADQFPKSQCSAEHILQNKTIPDCTLQVGRCDTGVQTEREPAVGVKIDVAIQCSMISHCTCKRAVSPSHGSSKADTTGGQD